MAYRFEIARRAEADLEELYLWVFELACERDLEGIVGKFAHSTYQSDGAATSWVKFKHAGYSQAEGGAELFDKRRSPTCGSEIVLVLDSCWHRMLPT